MSALLLKQRWNTIRLARLRPKIASGNVQKVVTSEARLTHCSNLMTIMLKTMVQMCASAHA